MTATALRLPAPRTPDARTAPPLRWGVLGTGWIAERFAAALAESTTQRVVAVGSRSLESAERFAEPYAGARAHGSYADLVNDGEVDVVYVATPHPSHLEFARLAVEAGKHVLVEKPMTITADDARALAGLARERGVFLMEAFWTKFLPRYDVIRQVLEAGILGDVHTVVADFGEWFPDSHRIMRRDLAGGPMLDLGTYPFGLITWVLGEPDEIAAFGQPSKTAGVNAQTAAILRFGDRAQAVVQTSILGTSPTTAAIVGDRAALALPGPFYQPGDVVLLGRDGREIDRWSEEPVAHRALFWQAAEVARCIEAGLTESPLHPLDATIASLTTMDAVRRMTGETFDGE